MIEEVNYIYFSKKGIARERNQDRIFIYENEKFYIFSVFDGVSSYSDSYLLINTYKKTLKKNIYKLDEFGKNLDLVLYECNKEILKYEFRGASTLSLLYLRKNSNIKKIVSLGDSRIYIFGKQYLDQITEDDSLILGGNIITKYIGSNELSINDFKPKELESDNNFLLCTDGFYSLMERNLYDYFCALNFKYHRNIKKKFSNFLRNKNSDDSTFIIVKNEVSK
jgi:serine/threonine protein phosphatase PrpC